MIRRAVLAVVLVVSIAACSDEPAGVGPDNGGAASASEPAVAPGPITLSLELERTEVPAGTPIEGVLVFENTGEPANVLHSGCTPHWGIALTNEEVVESVQFTAPCPTEPMHIPSGRSEVPITISTMYTSCGYSGSAGDAVPCLGGGRLPTLPPGVYLTALVTANGDDLGGPPPAPVTVTLTD